MNISEKIIRKTLKAVLENRIDNFVRLKFDIYLFVCRNDTIENMRKEIEEIEETKNKLEDERFKLKAVKFKHRDKEKILEIDEKIKELETRKNFINRSIVQLENLEKNIEMQKNMILRIIECIKDPSLVYKYNDLDINEDINKYVS